jgi:hypothetical protein
MNYAEPFGLIGSSVGIEKRCRIKTGANSRFFYFAVKVLNFLLFATSNETMKTRKEKLAFGVQNDENNLIIFHFFFYF